MSLRFVFMIIFCIFNYHRVGMEEFRFVPAIQRRSDWDDAKHTRPIPEIIVFFSPVNFPVSYAMTDARLYGPRWRITWR